MRSLSPKRISSVETVMMSRFVSRPEGFWNQSTKRPWINAKSYALELLPDGRWKQHPHNRQHMMNYSLLVDPQEMPTPGFDQFMQEAVDGDEETIRTLLAAMSYTVTSKKQWLKKCFFMHGETDSGKSVFLELVEALIPEDALGWAAIAAVFALVQGITMLPITPGSAGIAEIALVGMLAPIAGPEYVNEVAAGVLLYRMLTWILIIPAGGIYNGEDIHKYMKMGAAGVQLGTRFVATHECDADKAFKQLYVDSSSEDMVVIQSPVGMPGRAIRNPFLDEVGKGTKTPFKCPFHCIKTCDSKKSPYCIAMALANARKGKFKYGFAFAGENAYRINKIISVKELMDALVSEYSLAAA